MNSHSSGCTERVNMSRWSWWSLRISAWAIANVPASSERSLPIDGGGAGSAAGGAERAVPVKPPELAEPAGDGPLGADIGQPPSLLLVDAVTRHRGEDLLEVLAAAALGQLPGLALLRQPAHIDDRQ